MTRLLTFAMVVLLAGIPAADLAIAQGTACPRPLASARAVERSYARIDVREFEGRVFLYVPEITASGSRFEPFDVWVVEGVYGRPFVQQAGPMDPPSFERLRASTNVRATAVRVTRTPASGRVTIARQLYLLDVTVQAGARGGDAVSAAICRGR